MNGRIYREKAGVLHGRGRGGADERRVTGRGRE